MNKRFTEGICSDGAAILDNGKQITITEILNNLNRLDDLQSLIETWHDRQWYFEDLAKKTDCHKNNIKFNAIARTVRDCWKELYQFLESKNN